MARRTDAINLTGISSLMNTSTIKPGLNLVDCENEVIGLNSKKSTKDEGVDIDSEINSLAKSLGLDLSKPNIQVKKITDVIDLKKKKHNKSDDDDEDVSEYDDDEEGSEYDDDDEDGSEYTDESGETGDTGETGETGETDDYSEYSESSSQRSGKSRGSSKSHGSSKSRGSRGSRNSHDSGHKKRDRDGDRRREHDGDRRREHDGDRHNRPLRVLPMPTLSSNAELNTAFDQIQADQPTAIGASREKIADEKRRKIDKIQQLYGALEEDGIDCSKITIPSVDHNMSEIDSILSTLQLKTDRNRYSTLANEVIMGMAEVVETVFNGERTIPLTGWRPDYTNYSATVAVKLHRMKYETSQIVSDFINEHKIGIKTRLALELLPSLIMYPSQQARNKKERGLNADSLKAKSRLNAISSIRGGDIKRDIDELDNI